MITTLTDPLYISCIARAAHEANNAFRVSMSQKPYQAWYLLPEYKRLIAINGVYAALGGATPEQMHESWVKTMTSSGWTYGPIYDEKTKRHPAIMDFKDLPPYEKAKDELFIRVVRAMVDAIETGLQP